MKTLQKLALIAILFAPFWLKDIVKASDLVLTPASQVQMKVESKQGQKSCSISGRLFGSGIERERSYYVVPSDPDNDAPSSKMARVDSSNPSYRLSSLPTGRYVLRVFRSESGSLLPVKTFPRQREVNCSTSAVRNVDFEVQ
ncbi:hypothetical protein [Aerosakkonema funiforme]|uniref:hypothetical protein n=1 Tax=Aerosakkonema funiforme TaxID=1246630 RepID=UPI0035BB230F